MRKRSLAEALDWSVYFEQKECLGKMLCIGPCVSFGGRQNATSNNNLCIDVSSNNCRSSGVALALNKPPDLSCTLNPKMITILRTSIRVCWPCLSRSCLCLCRFYFSFDLSRTTELFYMKDEILIFLLYYQHTVREF